MLPTLSTIILTLTLSFSPVAARTESVEASRFSTAYDLIDAVSSLRAANGLPPYTTNSILMGIAQGQAEYNLSIGTVTHVSADGLRPFQRALLAGYPVAGDISQGGFFSENIVYGSGLTAEGAVEIWMGDAPHQNTMLSGNFQDVGAGVAISGNTYFYVLDAGLSTGGVPAAFTPPPSYSPPVATLIPNTPNADGSVTYIVQPGDILGAISQVYDISVADLRALNNLSTDIIYPKQVLIIRNAYTPTATQPTATPTGRPTITPWPTSTPTSTETPVPPTPTPSPGLPVSVARGSVIAIVVAALVISALLALLGRKHK